MDVISVVIIPSWNRLHPPILSCDNAMCLNLGGSSIIASSIVIVPHRRTYFTILSVKSGSVPAFSSHRSSAVVPSWNASTRPASGHRRTCVAVSMWIVQQRHLSHSPSQCGLDGSHCGLNERIVGEAIDCKSIVGETIIGGTIDGELIISVSGVIVGVAIVREAIMGGDGAVLAG